MAVRVQTQHDISFGTMGADVTVTHGRFQKAGANPVVVQLTSSITVNSGNELKIDSGDMDVVYPSGDLNNDHMEALVDSYWDGETFQVDMMTSSTAVVTTSGYSQQTYSTWQISTEND